MNVKFDFEKAKREGWLGIYNNWAVSRDVDLTQVFTLIREEGQHYGPVRLTDNFGGKVETRFHRNLLLKVVLDKKLEDYL